MYVQNTTRKVKMGLPKRKYSYPDDLEEWEEFLNLAEDGTLKKFWRYLPLAKTDFESKVVLKLTDELVSRGLK